MNVADLVRFRAQLDLAPETFQAITGINAHKLRRGRVRDPIALTPEQTKTVFRCIRAYSLALEMSGGRDRALCWLYSEAPAFGNRCPISLCQTAEGILQMERHLAVMRAAAKGIPHGVR